MSKALRTLDQKLHELGVDKTIFYRIPRKSDVDEDEKSRYATVCLLIIDGKAVARGISVCSPVDNWNKNLGKNISLGRAIKALIHKKRGIVTSAEGLPIARWEVHPHLEAIDEEFLDIDSRKIKDFKYEWETFVLKSCYMPKLTNHEQFIMTKAHQNRVKEGKNGE